ncbi:MAG: hypothetical protein II649_02825 [Kiritimatiellae bacterium]|nr:hypothetical protein [Kiritimatiellia bacterium]
MAGKNLDIKLVVDDAEAKRKIRETAAEAAKAAAPTPGSVPAKAGAEAGPPKTGALRPAADAEAAKAAGDAAKGMDEAGRKARELAGAAGGAGTAFQRVTRSFAGVAVSMGLNYARQFTREGSAAYNALGFASSAVGGMAMGAAAGSAIGAKYGPLGAAAGAAAGAGKGLLDVGKAGADRMRSEAEERAANSATLRGMVEAQDAARAFKATLDKVGDAEKSLAERQRLLAAEIKKREEADKRLTDAAMRAGQRVSADDPDAQKRFAKAVSEQGRNASELDALREVQKQLEEESKAKAKAAAEQRKANEETLQGTLEAQNAARAFKATLDQVGDAEKSLAERQRLLASEIAKREEADKSLAETARKAAQGVADPGADTAEAQKRFAKAMADMNRNASELDTLRALQEQLKAEATAASRRSRPASGRRAGRRRPRWRRPASPPHPPARSRSPPPGTPRPTRFSHRPTPTTCGPARAGPAGTAATPRASTARTKRPASSSAWTSTPTAGRSSTRPRAGGHSRRMRPPSVPQSAARRGRRGSSSCRRASTHTVRSSPSPRPTTS